MPNRLSYIFHVSSLIMKRTRRSQESISTRVSINTQMQPVQAVIGNRLRKTKNEKTLKVYWSFIFFGIGVLMIVALIVVDQVIINHSSNNFLLTKIESNRIIMAASSSRKNYYDHSVDGETDFVDVQPNITKLLEDWDRNDSSLLNIQRFLDNYICNTSHDNHYNSSFQDTINGVCHPRLKAAPHRRTQFLPLYETNTSTKRISKSRPIRPGETILVLPRKFLVWDLDAFRCKFIQQHLFKARHLETGNALDGGAFLAVFLLFRAKVSTGKWKSHPESRTMQDYYIQYTREEDEILNIYLKILPFYSNNTDALNTTNWSQFHPILWSDEKRVNVLGSGTLCSNLIEAYRAMIQSEYNALVYSSALHFDDKNAFYNPTSSEFSENINQDEYIQMRLHVITRSFGTGPPGLEETFNLTLSIQEELQLYSSLTGVYFNKGCRAMSPVLDMWGHHALPNADWKYDSVKRAFIVKAGGRGGIEPGYDVWVSYGKYSDTHLFSKFGFVNGDGSGYTESSVAVLHRLLDPGMGQQYSFMSRDESMSFKPISKDTLEQKKDILKYLTFDDGYTECIHPVHNSNGFTLKRLKFQHLMKIANVYDRWVIKWNPRNSSSLPLRGSILPISSKPPSFDVKRVMFDGSKVLSTCRLITLINDDYNGRAIQVLEDALNNESFIVERQNDFSEYRSLICLARLSSIALSRYPQSTMDYFNSLSSSLLEYGSPLWFASQVIFGEMLSLESLRNIASSGSQIMVDKHQLKENHDASAFIRKQSCPIELSLPVLNLLNESTTATQISV